jgi:dynein assembly factor 5
VGTARHLGLLVPLLTGQLKAEDPELRLAVMLLLEAVVSSQACQGALAAQAKPLLSEALLPNVVWRAGRVAATVRKVALVCLYTLLREGRVPLEALVEVVPPLLPVLKTNLEDYDASSRQLVTLSLERIFAYLPGAFDEEPIRQLYPELLKRLDDSSDEVRRAACAAISAFFSAAAPAVFRGGILDYMLDQLFVHLDDQEVSMQEAVLGVLKAAVRLDADAVGKKAQAARGSHRSPRFCDELLEAVRRGV